MDLVVMSLFGHEEILLGRSPWPFIAENCGVMKFLPPPLSLGTMPLLKQHRSTTNVCKRPSVCILIAFLGYSVVRQMMMFTLQFGCDASIL